MMSVLQVAYDSNQLQMEDILESIRDAGFEADLLSSKPAEHSGKASLHNEVDMLVCLLYISFTAMHAYYQHQPLQTHTFAFLF